MTERYQRLGLNAGQGTAHVAALQDKDWLRSATVRTPEATFRFLELTNDGRRALGLAPATERHGSVEHRYWIERIARGLEEQGVAVEKEAPLGEGKAVDLLATVQGRRVGVEVETGRSDWVANARKCLEAGLDQVVVAFTSAQEARMGGAKLDQMGPGVPAKVRLVRAWEVVDLLLAPGPEMLDSERSRQDSASFVPEDPDSADSPAG